MWLLDQFRGLSPKCMSSGGFIYVHNRFGKELIKQFSFFSPVMTTFFGLRS
jgi:hypothetical protein